MSNFISYYNLINSRNEFRKSGTKSGSEFNIYDTPGQKYFKLFFYFNNGDEAGNQSISSSGGLLAPTWLLPNLNDSNYHLYNSAWSYLKMNDEDYRSNLLEKFVNLLSNISSESSWYFSELSGLEAALERKVFDVENFTIEQNRPKISIKCLPDSVDDRLGSLLDLYRSIVVDWSTKREVIPANLRKFDMGIMVFETPNSPFHKRQFNYSGIGDNNSPKTSYKYIELHNCEIDYNSTKAVYNLNNKEGSQPEYIIDINFDDCYESRYNEFFAAEFGDLIVSGQDAETNYNEKEIMDYENNISQTGLMNPWDLLFSQEPLFEQSKSNIDGFHNKTISGYQGSKQYDYGFFGNAVNQLISTGVKEVNSLLKKAVLGNLYTFSLTKIGNQLKTLAGGDIMSTVRAVNEYSRASDKRNEVPAKSSGNLFPTKKITPTIKKLGNLAQGNTLVNNL